jgi:hypothetical protein
MHLLLTKTRLDTTYCTNTLCMHWVFIQQTFRCFHLLFPNAPGWIKINKFVQYSERDYILCMTSCYLFTNDTLHTVQSVSVSIYNHSTTLLLEKYCIITLCRTTLSARASIIIRGKTHQCSQRKQSDCLMFMQSYMYHVSWSHGHVAYSSISVSVNI